VIAAGHVQRQESRPPIVRNTMPTMTTIRPYTVLVFAVAFALASLSCNRAPAAGDDVGKPVVALVLKTLNHPFFVDMRRGAQDAADRLGVTLQVQAAEREIDVEKQMQIVENLLQTGIQVLCITPSGSTYQNYGSKNCDNSCPNTQLGSITGIKSHP
jgi:hypothetical protein